MAINAALREAETALEEIRKEETGVFDATVFGLLAELIQYEKLRQNKLPAKMMEQRWGHISMRIINLAKDWKTLHNMDDDQGWKSVIEDPELLEEFSKNGGLTL